MDGGSHAAFILLAYAAAALLLAGLVGWTMLDYRAQRRALAEFEGRGVLRRSAAPTRNQR